MILEEFMNSPVTQRVGWVLVHFLWQGAAGAAVLWVVLMALARRSAGARYAAGVCVMGAMVLMPVGTFAWLSQRARSVEVSAPMISAAGAVGEGRTEKVGNGAAPEMAKGPAMVQSRGPVGVGVNVPPPARGRAEVEGGWVEVLWMAVSRGTPAIVAAWAVGVWGLGLWHVWGWIAARRLCALAARKAEAGVQAMFERLKARLGVMRPVELLESAILQTPAVIGWLRPVVLVPTAVLSGLTPAQLEAILAHELAHVRRHDYLVNLLQTFAETVLFYHPGIWWVSQQIRQEREHCCDDVAAGVCGDRIVYAEALLGVERARGGGRNAALAPGATGGLLLPRIRRILHGGETAAHRGWSPAAALMALGLLLAPFVLNHARERAAGQRAAPTAVVKTLAPAQGVVRDAEGNPVVGAQLILYHDAGQWGFDDRTLEKVVSDGQGRFRFTTPMVFEAGDTPEAEQYVLLAKDAAHAVAWQRVRSGEVAPAEGYVLHMTQGMSQLVRVTDRAGKPLAGVRVGLSQAGGGTSEPDPWLQTPFNLYSDPQVVSGLTDAGGEVTLTNLPNTGVLVIARASGYGQRPMLFDLRKPAGVTIQLAPSTKVEGRAVDPQGRGIAGALVKFQPANASFWYIAAARTDAAGQFGIELVSKEGLVDSQPPGNGVYNMMMQHPDWTAKQATLTADGGEVKNLTLHGERGVLVNGRLLEAGTEKPVEGATVRGDTPAGRLYAQTGVGGRFQWRVPGGTVTAYFQTPPAGLFVRRDEREPPRTAVLALDGTEKQAELTLHTSGPLDSRTMVTGRLMSPEGQALGNLRVEASADFRTGGFFGRATSDEEGRFTLKDVPVKVTVNMYAEAKDRSLAVVRQIQVSGQESSAIGDVVLQRTQAVDVPVVDGSGQPRANTRVNVFPSFNEQTVDMLHQLNTDEAGHLKVEGIVPGMEYQVRLAHVRPGSDPVLEASCVYLTLAPKGGEAPKAIVLSEWVPVRVVDAAGKVVNVQDISTLEVEIAERSWWQLGSKPEIKQRGEEGWVQIDREQVILARKGNAMKLTFKTGEGVTARAEGTYPDNTSRLTFTLLSRIGETGVTPGGPANVAADELAGRIVDGEGKAVAGATVRFPDWGDLPDPIAPMTTGADGVFRLAHAPRFLYMQVDAAGYGRRWLTGVPVGKGMTIALDRTTRVRGSVRKPDGTPAASAALILETARPREDIPGMTIDHLQIALHSGPDGGFESFVEPGEYELRASGSGGVFARIGKLQVKAGQTLEQAVVLAPGVHLRVKAVDVVTGKPVAGARFVMEKQLPGVILPEPGSERTANAEGVAEWESTMPGMQTLNVFAEGYARWGSPSDTSAWKRDELEINGIRLELQPGMDEVLVKMEQGMRVKGKVVDKEGKPVARVFVNVEGFQTGDRRYMRPTNAQGEFDLLVPAKFYSSGMYHVAVTRTPNYRTPDAVGEEFAPKAGGERTFVITLESGAGPPASVQGSR